MTRDQLKLNHQIQRLVGEFNSLKNESSPHPTTMNLNIEDKSYNPKYNQDAECICGHPYHRHFDWMDNNEYCSCKYCDCDEFTPKGN